jgi:hypothetical protein
VHDKLFHPLDALTGGADMTALASVCTSLDSQAVIRLENDAPAAKDGREVLYAFSLVQDSPADRRVPDIKCNVKFFACHHMSSHGIKIPESRQS